MIRKHLATTLLSCALVFSSTAAAQGPTEAIEYIDDLLGDASGLLTTVCNSGSRSFMGVTIDDILSWAGAPDARSLLYICDYRNVLTQAQRSTSNIVQAIDTGGQSLGNNLLPRLFHTFGGNADPAEDPDHPDLLAQARLEGLREEMRNSSGDPDAAVTLEDYQAALYEEITLAEERAIARLDAAAVDPETLPEGTPERELAEMIAANPAYLYDSYERIHRAANTARQAALSSSTLEASNLALDEFINNTSYQETILRTIEPLDPTTGQGGTAAQLEQRAGAATSTREAVNELSRGWADYMRQDAVMAGAVVEGLKSIATQQSLTNWQLSQEADRLYAQRYAQIEAEAAAQEAEMMAIASDFNSTIEGFTAMFEEYTNMFMPFDDDGDAE